MARIAQLANFVAPHSGGIRTVLAHLSEGYARHGHDVVQVIPGPRTETHELSWGRLVMLRGIAVASTGYRVLPARRVRTVLDQVAPDKVEVHDRSTLRSIGGWARDTGVDSCVVSHERLDRLMTHWTRLPAPSRRVADWSNAALARAFDTVVCTTAWAAEEFDRIGAANVRRVPLGVDTDAFTPAQASDSLRARLAHRDEILLVVVSRLSPEKQPELAVDTVAELVARGVRVRLVVAGAGPQLDRLRERAGALPVRFLGHLDSAVQVAQLQASADVILSPGPVETFGLAAVEALACGTPVVVNERSALPGVIGTAGLSSPPTARAFADAVTELTRDTRHRREAARRHALRYSWPRTVTGFLAVHGLSELNGSVVHP